MDNDNRQFEPLLNDAEAASFLGGLHSKTVQRMAQKRGDSHYRVGKYYRYRASELKIGLCYIRTARYTRLPQFERR